MEETSALTIRPATAADAPALGKLGALLVNVHHNFDPDRFIAATRDTEQSYGDFLMQELSRSDKFVFVAEEAGMVLAYAYAGVEGNDYMALRGPAGVVYDLVVDPTHRRKGI